MSVVTAWNSEIDRLMPFWCKFDWIWIAWKWAQHAVLTLFDPFDASLISRVSGQWRLFIKMATDWQVSEVGGTCRPAVGPGRRRSVQIEWLSAGTAHLGFPALLSVPHLLSRKMMMNRHRFTVLEGHCKFRRSPAKRLKVRTSGVNSQTNVHTNHHLKPAV